MPQGSKNVRRRPKQQRAITTREAVFEAAAQILEREGETSFTTNRIAERAGVSIGTLYQYFDNKEAILIEMTRHESSRHKSDTVKAGKRGSETKEALRDYVRAMVGGFKGRPATRRAAIKAWLTVETPRSLASSINEVHEQLPKIPGATRVDTFLISRTLLWTVRAAVLEDFKALHTREFEDGLVDLLNGYVQQVLARGDAGQNAQ